MIDNETAASELGATEPTAGTGERVEVPAGTVQTPPAPAATRTPGAPPSAPYGPFGPFQPVHRQGGPAAPPYPPTRIPMPAPPPVRQQPPGNNMNWLFWVIGGIVGFVLISLLVAVVVAVSLFAVIGRITSGPIAGPTGTATVTKTFAVAGTPQIDVFDSAGTVTVVSSQDGQVAVSATKVVQGSNDQVVQSGLRNLDVAMTQSGNTISLTARFAPRYVDGGPAQRHVDLVLTVPGAANLGLQVAAGTLDVHGVTGVLTADVTAGNVTATRVTLSDGSRVMVGAGNITLDGRVAQAASVGVTATAGNVRLTLPSNTPAQLEAATSAGSITIHGWPIAVTRHAAGQDASGPLGLSASGKLTVDVTAGNITLTAS